MDEALIHVGVGGCDDAGQTHPVNDAGGGIVGLAAALAHPPVAEAASGLDCPATPAVPPQGSVLVCAEVGATTLVCDEVAEMRAPEGPPSIPSSLFSSAAAPATQLLSVGSSASPCQSPQGDATAPSVASVGSGRRATALRVFSNADLVIGPALGFGTYGDVHQAVAVGLPEPLAVKMLRLPTGMSGSHGGGGASGHARTVHDSQLQLLMREARLLLSVSSPYVVRVHGLYFETSAEEGGDAGLARAGLQRLAEGVGESADSPLPPVTRAGIVMERAQCSVAQLLRPRKGGRVLCGGDAPPDLSIPQRLQVLYETALGLADLHASSSSDSQGGATIIHGDVKAANILLASSSGGATDGGGQRRGGEGSTGQGRALLCDFGFAKMRKQLDDALASATVGGITGTPLWRAPELFGRKPLPRSAATDAYAFGITMWEVLTGRVPYAEQPEELDLLTQLGELVRAKDAPLRPDTSLLPDATPLGVQRLMEDLWHPDPAARPDLEAAAARLARSSPGMVVPVERGGRAPSSARSRRGEGVAPEGEAQLAAPRSRDSSDGLTARPAVVVSDPAVTAVNEAALTPPPLPAQGQGTIPVPPSSEALFQRVAPASFPVAPSPPRQPTLLVTTPVAAPAGASPATRARPTLRLPDVGVVTPVVGGSPSSASPVQAGGSDPARAVMRWPSQPTSPPPPAPAPAPSVRVRAQGGVVASRTAGPPSTDKPLSYTPPPAAPASAKAGAPPAKASHALAAASPGIGGAASPSSAPAGRAAAAGSAPRVAKAGVHRPRLFCDCGGTYPLVVLRPCGSSTSLCSLCAYVGATCPDCEVEIQVVEQ